MQNKVDKVLNMKRYVDHRWTSLRDSVERVLDLWEHLETHFNKEKSELAENFTNQYLLYINLLSIFLNKICYYIVYFEDSELF